MSPVGPRLLRRAVTTLALTAAVAGCGSVLQSAPQATPADFPGMAGVLTQQGIRVDGIVSGDAGCDDIELARTAIGFDASGLDQATPVRVHAYIFRNRAAYERLRATIDGCAAAFVTDPATFESIEASPYVIAGQGPWSPAFRDAVRAAVMKAAGTGN